MTGLGVEVHQVLEIIEILFFASATYIDKFKELELSWIIFITIWCLKKSNILSTIPKFCPLMRLVMGTHETKSSSA